MKATTFSKATIGLAAAATMSFGLFVPAYASASTPTASEEDPTTSTYLGAAGIGPDTLVGTGSDTTQDVIYGIAQDLGTLPDGTAAVASWTATGATAMSYRSGGAPATPTAHPNGSGAGFLTLKESIGAATTATDGVAAGDVDFSRASGFQGNEQTNSGNPKVAGNGVVTEIPFAVDSVSIAAPAGSPFIKTNGGLGLTVANLAAIYLGNVNEVNTTDGTLAKESVAGTVDAGYLPIHAYLPKPGSGSRQFFLGQLNKVNSSVALGTNKGDSFQTTNGTPVAGAPYIGNTDLAGANIVEHDATALTETNSQEAALAPFSGAKYIGYHNSKIADPSGKIAGQDYVLVPFDSAVGGTDHSVLPYVDNSGVYSPNSAYKSDAVEGSAKLTREVFNIVATRAIKEYNLNAHNRAIFDTFVGAGSKVCLDSATIEGYGFIKNANCGNISRSANTGGTDTGLGFATSTVTVSNTAAVAGKTSVFTVGVTSNSNGGGALVITINGTTYRTSIAAGATSVNITVPTPHAGTFSYGNDANVPASAGDGFYPTLQGVASAPINTTTTALTYTVAKASPVITATSLKYSHTSTAGYTTVKVAATGLVPTGSVVVYLRNSAGTLKYSFAAKALASGTVKYTFGKALAVGTYYVYVSYTGNADVTAKSNVKTAGVISVY